MWWRKKKNGKLNILWVIKIEAYLCLTHCLDEEADLEAGNVEKVQQIPDGQIDATQEFEDGKEVSLIFYPL